ncbi:MAG: DUF429 domain-containing protein [Synechococcus sp. SB0668_bin_15]|nr:DUF429 domain-containing protein [Synechococcus sp. SB0668_bin_15]MXZ83581.1 DUF429 domain-containing protein [Synechococcus sp. SB0666_bin_14]MYA91158.1 DUF429 domain-containing protein [Synechococcus sp. SB0663_bin_10]MYC48848.1 DUF429 domain-containing protein [Synechococcus sp. SB0662_bin_14]MYG46853.1 DUF429 domain-containing protein [Synechococcus sp. SB0675_bin_6]MYJ59446.1 DUF429 domain-containing protein [Synechococcus sp. SB0672_bin_6]MYK91544.1 DUF429 domain-containing protein [
MKCSGPTPDPRLGQPLAVIRRPIGPQGSPTVARLGLDGCRGGWILARLTDERLTLSLLASLKSLEMGEQHVGCIDMPIGLTSHGQSRCCDRWARRLLAPAGRSSSVFSPPGRCCLSLPSHGLATAAQRSGGGPGLSIQSWHLLKRIRELDGWLQAQPQRPRQLRECHPELTFLQLQQRHQPQWPAPVSKHGRSGQHRRLQLLGQHWGWDPTGFVDQALVRSSSRHLQRHDLVDALACLAVAMDRQRQTLPSIPATDAAGLPMAITCLGPG